MKALFSIFASWCVLAFSFLQAEGERPNIIFVLCDDLGWGDLGVFYQNSRDGEPSHATPKLDQFAAEGMQLRQHYCPAPVCAPSRASLLSGRHQGHEPIRDNQFDKALADSHTLGSVLRTAGYRTVMVGKYGLPGGEREEYVFNDWTAYPTLRGFDEFFGYVKHRDGHMQYPAHVYERGDSELHKAPKPVYHNEKNVGPDMTGCYTTDLYAAFAKKWIVEHRENHPKQPFFMYLAHSTPHAALQVPTMPYPEGGGLSGGVQWLGKAGRMINTAREPIDSWIHPDYAAQDWPELEKRFATMVRRIDSTMGDLVQTLRDLGIDRETLVVFTSDNGPHQESYLEGLRHEANHFDSFGPFHGIKRDVLEGGVRMPTLVRWPGSVPARAINETPSQFHDWMPTFASLAGLPSPALSDGVSLLPYLTGDGSPRESAVYIEYNNNGKTPDYPEFDSRHRGRKRGQMQVLFVDGYKGVRMDIQSHADDFEIYDLKADPREIRNLAGSSAYFNALQKRMKDRALQMRRPDPSAPRPYDDAFISGIARRNDREGVAWRLFEGDFPWVPQTAELTPVRTGRASSVDLKMLRRDYNAAVEFKGFLKIDQQGEYVFKVESDGGAVLRVHDAVVVDNESAENGKRQTEGSIRLESGVHPYTLVYRAGGTSPRLEFSYSQ